MQWLAKIIMVLLPKTTGGWRPTWPSTSALRVNLRWPGIAVTSSWSEVSPGPTGSVKLGTPANTRPGGPACMEGEFDTSVGFSAASALSDLAEAFEHSRYLPPVENGSETQFPTATPAVPDWCVRWASAPHGGKRGDEDAALGCVATASACDSLVHGACGRDRGPRGLPPRSWRSSQMTRGCTQQQSASGCSPHANKEPGGRQLLRRQAHGRQGHGDASKAVQGLDHFPETPTSSGKVARLVKTAAVPSLIYGSDVSGMPPAQLNEARLIAQKIC